jgi:penicillin-binding protein 1C
MSSKDRKTTLRKIYQSFLVSTKTKRLRTKIALGTIPLILIFLVLYGVFLFKDIPNPTSLTKNPAPVSTQLLDRNGKLLYEVFSSQNRNPIKITQLPSYVSQTTVSIEDKNFYKHFGLDFVGIIRAALNTLTGKRLEGGSTITQQLVKNALLADPKRTITRKIREAVLSLITEIAYTKEQILELYLNSAPYGGTAYGIETASQVFFAKPAKNLTLAQAALLAGLPQAPTKYSPFGANPGLAINRQHQVLRRMVEDGHITQDQADVAKKEKLVFATKQSAIKAPHFSLMVRDQLVDKYGEDLVNLGGLRVTTTLDLSLQEYAQASLSAEVKKINRLKISNGAALVTKPATGEILAMIGSADYFNLDNDGNVNVTTRLRQPGSSIKPLNYAVGLLNGWTASTMFLDLPTCFSVTGQPLYCPKNYDNTFRGGVQMRFALGNSLNIPAVKMLALNGLDSFIATASAMGISTFTDPSRYGLSLTLGGGEVTMTDMATAFGTLANAGVTVPLNSILKVETYQGKILEENHPDEITDFVQSLHENWATFWQHDHPFIAEITSQKVRVTLPEEVAYIVSHMLLDNNARVGAFGANSQLVIPGKTVSVKTGTTNDLRDNWTIGYTPDFLVATWVGNNDNTPMSYVASGVTGASPIWNKIMRHVLDGQKDHFPTQPEGIVGKGVCNTTGLVPTDQNSCETRNELFIKDIYPPTNIPTQKQIWVRRSDKYPLLPGDNTIDLDLEQHLVFSDPFVKEFCVDCRYPIDEKGQVNYPVTNINFNSFRLHPPDPHTFLN